MKQAKLIELGQMLEAWRHLVLPHGRTLTEHELCQLAPLTLLGRIVVVYCRLLQDDQERQDELLHDFIRSLAADLEQLQSLRRSRIPHSEDEKPK